jgi:hypothetical protein
MAMTGSLRRPSMTRWWIDQVQAESTQVPVPTAPPVPRETLAYPQKDGYYLLDFGKLSSFPANTPNLNNPRSDPRLAARSSSLQLPDEIRKLNGQKIYLTGFLVPMTTDKEKVYSFILAQTRGSCCYGLVPKINQWIYVTMAPGQSTDPLMDVPVTVWGTLSVDDHFKQQKDGWCLYRMVSDKVDLPSIKWF